MPNKDTEHYQLFVVTGGVEPGLYGGIAETWKELEKTLLEFLKSQDYDPAEDGLFFAELTGKNELKDIGSFSGGFMDGMRKKAGLGIVG